MVEMADVVGAEYKFATHEHRELRAGAGQIHEAADALGWTSNQHAADLIRGVRNWVQTVLVPHAAWEDAVVYPEIERRTGTEWSVKQARYEHYQIERAASQLTPDIEALDGPLTHNDTCEIRGHLLALEALLTAHIEREERFLFPLIAGELPEPGFNQLPKAERPAH
jgi:hemerythrin-like domain-containing protein